jgi:hypothetical protein
MTPYEELVAIVNGMGKEGKFVFIVDATHELTGNGLSKDIKNCQYQLFHFNMVEMTFAWLSRLIDECPDDTKSKMVVVLYHMERLVVHTAIEGSYEPTTVMRKILTPNGETVLTIQEFCHRLNWLRDMLPAVEDESIKTVKDLW